MSGDNTPNLDLPYLAPAQAQKHVTHNEAIRMLDALVQLAVLSRSVAAPPPTPADGDRYLPGASPSGAWAGHAGAVAAFQDGAWSFLAPRKGWLAWIADENALFAFDGTRWVAAGGGSINPAPLVGINATADTTNRLSVSSPASLFNHAGAGHQHKVNKATAADTASLLFQTGFSGRAEFGTAGDDDLHLKVSADGATWREALTVDRATGQVSLPASPGALLVNPWTGKKQAACGADMTASGVYTASLAAKLGATLTNLGVAGGTLGARPSDGQHAVSDALAAIPADADLVTLECGLTDFLAGVPLGTPGEATLSTFCGALRKAGETVLAANQKRTLVFVTSHATTLAGSGPGGAFPLGYENAVRDVARMLGCPCVDLGGACGVNATTAAIYLDAAGLWPNADGGARIAQHLFDKLIAIRPSASTLSVLGAPVFTPAAGSFATSQTVTLAPQQAGAAIRYTLDGATPTPASSLYTAPLAVSTTTTVKAIATLSGFTTSAVASAAYSITDPDAAFLGTLPASPSAVWAFDRFQTSPSPVVKNLVNAAVAPSANLWRAPRRMFANNEFWGGTTVTFTDDYATGPSGSETDASRLVGTGAWTVTKKHAGLTLPANVQYTIGVWIKSNTGSSQNFAFTPDNTATRVTTSGGGNIVTVNGAAGSTVATTTWQRFAFTFTPSLTWISGQRAVLCDFNGSTGADLVIRDLEMFSGAADLGTGTPDSHLYLGSLSTDTTVVPGTGYVDLSTGGTGLIQFATGAASGSFTAQAVLSKVAAGSGWTGFLSRVQNYTHFTAFAEVNGLVRDTKATTTAFGAEQQTAGLWTRLNRGYHLYTLRYDGTNAELWLDDTMMFRAAGALAGFTIRDFAVNAVSTVALYGGERYHGIAWWQRGLSNAEIRQSFSAWKTRAAASGLTMNGDTTNRLFLAEGDSRTATNTAWPYVFGGNASPTVWGANISISGSRIVDLVARQTTIRDMVPANKNGRKFIVAIGPMGANDLGPYAGATDAIAAQNYANALAAYVDTLYGYGVDKVIVSTELAAPANGSNTHNTRRALLNTIIKTSWPGSNAVLVADVAGDATMGTDTSFTDHGADWADSVHPGAAGEALMEPYYRARINSV